MPAKKITVSDNLYEGDYITLELVVELYNRNKDLYTELAIEPTGEYSFSIYGSRLETDEEYKERKKKARRSRYNIYSAIANERAEYERLKKKFENE